MIQYIKICLIFISFFFIQCNKKEDSNSKIKNNNIVKYASGFSIEKHEGYTIIEVTNPWSNASKNFKYILKDKNSQIHEKSFDNAIIINVPVKKIVVTSTTHIPSLEMLGVENSLIGFPKLDYISSEKIRKLIHQNKITELGNNQSLNTEKLLYLNPDVIIGYGLDNSNPVLSNLEKNGLKVMFDGDWNEQNPL